MISAFKLDNTAYNKGHLNCTVFRLIFNGGNSVHFKNQSSHLHKIPPCLLYENYIVFCPGAFLTISGLMAGYFVTLLSVH